MQSPETPDATPFAKQTKASAVWRGIAWVVGTVLLVLVLSIAAVIGGLQTEWGRGLALRALNETLSAAMGSTVHVAGLAPGFPLRLAFDELTLSDAGGAWLVVEKFEFHWLPVELLSATVAIDTLTAERIVVARLPQAESQATPEPAPAGLRLPTVPIDTHVDRLAIGTLELGAPVVGEPLTLTVRGHLGANAGATINSDLDVHRIDGGVLTLNASAQLDPRTSRLSVDVGFMEGPHGVVAALSGLPGGPPLQLALVGDGPLDAWDGRLEFTATDLVSLAADVRLRGEDGRRLEVDGRVDWRQQPPELIPVILRPAVAGGVAFAAAVDFSDGGLITLEKMALQAEGLRVAGRGTLDPAHDQLDVTVNADLAAKALARDSMGGFSFQSAQAQVAAGGSLARPQLRGEGVVDGMTGSDLTGGKLAWTASVLPVADESGDQQLRFTATAANVVASDANFQSLVGSKPDIAVAVRLNGAQTLLQLEELTVQVAAARLSGKGAIALDAADSNLDLVLAVDNLGAFSQIAGMPLAGSGQAIATVSGPIVQGKLSGSIKSELRDFVAQDPVVQAALGTRPKLEADLHYDKASDLDISPLRFAGRGLEANGTVKLSDGLSRLRAELQADIRDLGLLATAAGADARGRLRLTATASGLVADPAANAVVQVFDGRVGDVAVRSARLDVTATNLNSRPSGQIRADATTSEGPVQLAADYGKTNAETLEVRQLRANLLGVRLEGDLAVALASGLVRGRLVGGLPAEGVPLAQPRLRGDATFDVGMQPQGQSQRVDLHLRSGALTVVDGQTNALTVGQLRLDAAVADAFRAPRLTANANARKIQSGAEGPFDVAAEVSGPLSELAFRLDLTGPKDGPRSMHAAGRIDAAGQPLTMTIAQLDAQIASYGLALQQPMRITSGAGRLSIRDLDLTIGDGSLRGWFDVQPGSTSVVMNAERLPLGIVRAWVKGLPTGALSLQTSLTGNRGETTGSFEVRADDLQLADAKGSKAAKGRASVRGRLDGGSLDASGDATIADGIAADFSARIPLTVPAGQLSVRMPAEGALAARARLNVDLAVVAQALAFPDQRLAGRLNADFAAGGSLQRPELTGSAVLSNGFYENFVTGTLLTAIDGQVQMATGKVLTASLNALTKGQGNIAVDGQADLSAQHGPAIDMTVTAHQALLVHRDDVNAVIDASLRYQGGLTRGSLTGKVEPVSIEVRLLDRLPPSVVVIPVTEINRQGGNKQGHEKQDASAAPWVADLEIDIEMPRRVFVRGRGLESEWSGRLHVGGSTNTPQLTGTIEAIRGVFTFASKRFDVQKGIITFTGGEPIDPILNIAATYRTPTLTAVIGVTGTASDPKLGVTSQPALPQSEVLAQVLFGKSSSRLGPVEAVQLASAIDSLARGESWSEDMLGSVRQFLGLDVLGVGTSTSTTGDEQGASVEAGRYVTEGVYVGAKQGLTDSSTAGRVEVEIIPGLSVQSDLTQSAEGVSGSLGLRWKHDY